MWLNRAKGVTYCVLWYFSIWTGFLFVCCPLLPFILVFPTTFAPVMAAMHTAWELYPVSLMNVILGTKFYMSGDRISSEEKSIVIMNHRTRLDWNLLWAAVHYWTGPGWHKLKIILKSSLRHFPSLGWVMQVACMVYIQRKWDKDKETIASHLAYYKSILRSYLILIFPEGTDLTPESLAKSDAYAKKNDLKLFTRVLYPRKTGFVYLVRTMKQQNDLDAVYDLTIAYPDETAQTEIDVVSGIIPKEVHFHVVRYASEDLPDDEEELGEWLHARWAAKEEMLEKFHDAKKFHEEARFQHMGPSLYAAFAFWTALVIFSFYLLIVSKIFLWWTITHACVFLVLSFLTDGFQSLAIYVQRTFQK